MKKEQKIIMYASDEAAKQMTVTGWVSSTGRFWGRDEHMARYEGSTHRLCDCGEIMNKGWLKCQTCRDKQNNERFLALPFKEWDGETPLCLWHDDKYFFDSSDIDEYCDEQEVDPSELQLVWCEPMKLRKIDYDYWTDDMPENVDELPDEMLKLIDQMNEFIDGYSPNWWITTNIRTEYKPVSSRNRD